MNAASIRTLVATLALASASFSPVAQAQGTPLPSTITVPFAFEYGSHALPAGTYKIASQTDGIVRLSNGKDSSMVVIMKELSPYEARTNGVVFHKVGGQYFLRQILTAGSTLSIVLPEPKSEKRARAAQMAASHGAAELFEVAVVNAAN